MLVYADLAIDCSPVVDSSRFAELLEQLALPQWAIACGLPTLDLQIFDTVNSTNRTVWELLDAGATAGTGAIAACQEFGRGQWGKIWQSKRGGLYLSLAIAPNLLAIDAGQLTLSCAWGIASTLREYDIPVGLKWPNDLVYRGQKLGGILIETRLQHDRIRQAVVGVGINWENAVAPPGINIQTILKQRFHPQVAPKLTSLELLAAIAVSGILKGYDRWQQHGIDAILPDYQFLLVNLGQSIEVDRCRGRVIGVTRQGELRVSLPSPDDPAWSQEICLPPGAISLGYG